MDWKLADAKNRLSELVTRVSTEGPQTIRRHDEAFVVLSERSYRELTGEVPTFTEFLISHGPRADDLVLKRDPSPIRDPRL